MEEVPVSDTNVQMRERSQGIKRVPSNSKVGWYEDSDTVKEVRDGVKKRGSDVLMSPSNLQLE